jgi:hypothetical protein
MDDGAEWKARLTCLALRLGGEADETDDGGLLVRKGNQNIGHWSALRWGFLLSRRNRPDKYVRYIDNVEAITRRIINAQPAS